MERNKGKLKIGIISFLIIIGAAFLGWFIAGGFRQSHGVINGLVVNIVNYQDYSTKMITTYDQYQKVLAENGLMAEKDTLKEKNFKKKDYIVDYIPYGEDLKVRNIELTVQNNSASLIYYVNKSVEENEKLLLYFIPVKKGSIKEFTLANRKFVYE